MGKTILVSAGHSTVPPRDPGAVGNGFKEADLTLKLRDAVAAAIRSNTPNISVTEDGADGVNDPLAKALVLARRADVAVEFHWNAGPATATGIEVLSKPKHKAFAQRLAKAIGDATGIRLRGDKGWKADNSGQHHRLAFCEAGGLIVEVCFISNSADMAAYLRNFPGVVQNLAAAISGVNSTSISAAAPTLPSDSVETAKPEPTPSVPPPMPDLKRGDKGEAVYRLQMALRAHGFDIKADKDFGPATERAVKGFQTEKGLRPDGIAGRNTYAALGLK